MLILVLLLLAYLVYGAYWAPMVVAQVNVERVFDDEPRLDNVEKAIIAIYTVTCWPRVLYEL